MLKNRRYTVMQEQQALHCNAENSRRYTVMQKLLALQCNAEAAGATQ
jgi:hypothetical protein